MDNAELRLEMERMRTAANDAKHHTHHSKEAVFDSISALHRAGDLLESVNRVRPRPE